METNKRFSNKGKKLTEDDLKRAIAEGWERTRRDAFINWAMTVRTELDAIGYGSVKVQRALQSVRETSAIPRFSERITGFERWDAWVAATETLEEGES